MTSRVRIFFVNRAGEHLDRAQEQHFVPVAAGCKVLDATLELRAHGIDRDPISAAFRTALALHAVREIAACYGAARFSQRMQRSTDSPRAEDAECNAHQNRIEA